jgi:hypothetical protein
MPPQSVNTIDPFTKLNLKTSPKFLRGNHHLIHLKLKEDKPEVLIAVELAVFSQIYSKVIKRMNLDNKVAKK